MPRYFFDLQDGGASRDAIGSELADDDAARLEAMRMLPELALHRIVRDGDKQEYIVLVTNTNGEPVYSAALSFTGVWLSKRT